MNATEYKGRLITVCECAALLSVKESWVYTKVAANEIPHKKVGRYVRFDAEQVLRWLEAESQAAKVASPR